MALTTDAIIHDATATGKDVGIDPGHIDDARIEADEDIDTLDAESIVDDQIGGAAVPCLNAYIRERHDTTAREDVGQRCLRLEIAELVTPRWC